MHPQDPTQSATPLEILEIRPDVRGIWVTLRCMRCERVFERPQTTLGGVPVGRHACPACGVAGAIRPEQFLAALERLLPPLPDREVTRLTEAATVLTESWHRTPDLADLLSHRGIDLGPPTERALAPLVGLGLWRLMQRGRGDR